MNREKKRGFTLIAAIFVMLVFSLLVITTSTLVSSEAVNAVRSYYSQRAFYIAEAGLNFVIASSLEGNDDWSGFDQLSLDFAGGTFTVENISPETNSAVLRSTGVYPAGGLTSVTRVIQQGITQEAVLPQAFYYALYWNNSLGTSDRLNVGGILFNADIEGNVFGDGNFNVRSGSSVSDGQIYVTEGYDVTGSGSYSWEVISEQPPWPALDNTYYTNLINYYDALIPTFEVDPDPNISSTIILTLEGETISYEAITIGSSGNVTVYG